MARPAKATATKTGQITKAEKEGRKFIEEALRGTGGDIVAPDHLTADQKGIFDYILEQLEESKLLGQLDTFILAKAAVTIDRLQKMDDMANKDMDLLFSNGFRLAQSQATQEFFRCCNELCLSPQARAKLSISAVKAQDTKKQTLMDMLNAEDED